MYSTNTIHLKDQKVSIFKILSAFLPLCLATPRTAMAEPFSLQPYVGLDYYQRSLAFTEGYGKSNFNKRLPQGNILIGFNLNDYLGIEAGYLFSQFSSRTSITTEGEMFLGNLLEKSDPVDPEVFEVSQNKINLTGPHIQLNGYLPFNSSKLYGIASVGISLLNLKSNIKPITNEMGFISSEFIRNFSTRRVILRGMTGLGYKITDTYRIRLLIGYETTSRFKNIAPKETSPLRISLKNNILCSIGLTAQF